MIGMLIFWSALLAAIFGVLPWWVFLFGLALDLAFAVGREWDSSAGN